MYIIYVVDIDYHNNVNNNTLFSKLEKEVYFKLVAKSNLALDVLFRFNLKSIFLKIPSAMGDLQMFPRQTKITFIITTEV